MQPQGALKSKAPTGLDLNRSLLSFFDKKSFVEKLTSVSSKNTYHLVLYDILLKELIASKEPADDSKLAVFDDLKSIFDANTLATMKSCIKNECKGISTRLKHCLASYSKVNS